MNELKISCEKAVKKLIKSNISISTAESCTGGLLSSMITSVPGASRVFSLGMATYSATAKTDILGVSKKTVKKYGVVSRQTAKEMAKRIRKLAFSDIGVSVTGAAGPEPCDGKPVGTVYFAIAYKKEVAVQKLVFEQATREDIRNATCVAIFNKITDILSKKEKA